MSRSRVCRWRTSQPFNSYPSDIAVGVISLEIQLPVDYSTNDRGGKAKGQKTDVHNKTFLREISFSPSSLPLCLCEIISIDKQ
jgi:hypothetical protein